MLGKYFNVYQKCRSMMICFSITICESSKLCEDVLAYHRPICFAHQLSFLYLMIETSHFDFQIFSDGSALSSQMRNIDPLCKSFIRMSAIV